MSCLFCCLLFSFVSRLSFNFDHPLPAMYGSQTTMDTVHQHPLPWAPPGCSKAYAWPAKWSNDRRGAGWISRPPTAHRSWGSLETWETERNGINAMKSRRKLEKGCKIFNEPWWLWCLDLKLWRQKTCAQKPSSKMSNAKKYQTVRVFRDQHKLQGTLRPKNVHAPGWTSQSVAVAARWSPDAQFSQWRRQSCRGNRSLRVRT